MVLSPIDLSDKVALVTGAGSNGGIGHGIALGLARFGANVLAVDIDAEGAAGTADEIRRMGGRSVAVRCDTAREADILAMFEVLDREFGRVDILVNNAGVLSHIRPEDTTVDDWNRVLAVDLTGYFLAAREAGRRMIRCGKGGSIISISSIAGSLAVGRGNLAYSVCKAGVNQMTRELAIEWARYGIRVNAIQPANIRTPALQKLIDDPDFGSEGLIRRMLSGTPLNRLGEPDDIAGAVVFLASDLASWMTGVMLPVDGGNLAVNAIAERSWLPGEGASSGHAAKEL